MSGITEEERQRLIAKGKEAVKNAPAMPEEDACRLHDKWKRDSASFNERMVSGKDE